MVNIQKNNHLSIINNHLTYANRLNTPNPAATPNKPPIQPKLSTNYEVIITNKANFSDTQMNVSCTITKDYENKTLGGSGKNKANSKPNKANSKPIKANLPDDQMNVNNVNKVLTRDYENTSNLTLFENKANTNPIKAKTTTVQIKADNTYLVL